MATLARNPGELDTMRRLYEFEDQTRRDKARFAAWSIAILIAVAVSMAAGLLHSGWIGS